MQREGRPWGAGNAMKEKEKEKQSLKVVIVGNGKVGFSLAEQLVKEKYDVTIVDMREDSLRRASDALDIMSIRGNGVSAATLADAGAAEADLLVAAKHMGAKFTIARIRNPEYSMGLNDLKKDLGIDMIINPENATAIEISRLLRFPSAANIETFCRGRVELMGFRIQEGDFMAGKPLYDLSDQVKRLSLLFCAVDREGEVTIPNGSFVPQVGDKLYLVGRPPLHPQGEGRVHRRRGQGVPLSGGHSGEDAHAGEDRGDQRGALPPHQRDLPPHHRHLRRRHRPGLITAAQILQVVRGMQNSQGSVMNTFYRIADGSAEAMEFTVRDTTRHLKTPLKDLHLKNGILLAVIMRGREIIIPEGSSYIQEGDSVILISRGWRILDLNDIYEEEIPMPSAASLNGRG